MNIRPLADRVVVRPEESATQTASGLYIPEAAKEKPQQGKVLAVGEGRRTDQGEVVPMTVRVGDSVLYGKYAGTEIEVERKAIFILRESDILAVVGGE